MTAALEVLKAQGAILVDPVEIETLGKFDDSELTVLLYELKADIGAYLTRLGPGPGPFLKEIIEFNERNAATEMPYFRSGSVYQSGGEGRSPRRHTSTLSRMTGSSLGRKG